MSVVPGTSKTGAREAFVTPGSHVRLAANRLGATSSAGPVAVDAGAAVGAVVVVLVASGLALAFGDATLGTGENTEEDSTPDPGAAPPLHPIRLAPQITAAYVARRTFNLASKARS
jgi:hypothetical protein